MLLPDRIIENLPSSVYSQAPNSRIKILLDSLFSSVSALEMRIVQTYLDMFIRTCRFEALDFIWGNAYSITRLPHERYAYRPFLDDLTPEQWSEVDSKDSLYRNRLLKFIDAVVTGGVAGIKLGVEAAIGCSADVFDQWHYDAGHKDILNDPLGIYEFVIFPHKPNFTIEDSFRIKSVVDRIKPAHTIYRITDGIDKLVEEEILDISVSSQFFQTDIEKNIFERIREYDTPNKVTSLDGVSSELLQEDITRLPGQWIKSPDVVKTVTASGSPNVQRNISFHSSSVDCWYGYNASLHGHMGSHACDGDSNTYWMSVSNADPTGVYAFEWVQVQINESDEGRGFNTVRLQLPYPNMSMWISVMDVNGTWRSLGGGNIPYDPTHTASYPNGSDIPWVFYTPDTGAADTAATWHEFYLGRWFPDIKYVRVTFHNLYNSGIGPYFNRAAVTEFQVWADIEEYYSPQRVLQKTGEEAEIPWISQHETSATSNAMWIRCHFGARKTVNRMRIIKGNRTNNPAVNLLDENGTTIKSNVRLTGKTTNISFNDVTTSFITIVNASTSNMSLLSGNYGMEICIIEIWREEYQEGDSISSWKKLYPGKNVCDDSIKTFWTSAQYKGPSDSVEWVQLNLLLTLPEESPAYCQINKVMIWSPDRGMEIRVRYYEPTWDEGEGEYTYRWRYAPGENAVTTNSDYVTELTFSEMVNAAALRVEFSKLAKQSNGMYAARVKEIKAWARVSSEEEKEELLEETFSDWGADKMIDGSTSTHWRSIGSISPKKVEWVNFSTPSSGGAIAGIYIDPETPGCSVSVYYSDDNENWEPIHRDYWLEKEMLWLPTPINARYWKLEFSNLQPRIYGYIVSGSDEEDVLTFRLDMSEIQRKQERAYTQFLDSGMHTYVTRATEYAYYPRAYYAGIREIKVYREINLGRDIYEFTDSFADEMFVNYNNSPSASGSDLEWNPEEQYMQSPEGESDCIFFSTQFDLAVDLKAISFNADEYIPSGADVTWYASRNGEQDWHIIEYIKNEDNAWFEFPGNDNLPWETFSLMCIITNIPGDEQYILNSYTVEFCYYKLL